MKSLENTGIVAVFRETLTNKRSLTFIFQDLTDKSIGIDKIYKTILKVQELKY